MECYYGDGFLCRVEKRDDEAFENLATFQISALCNDVGVLDMFFDEYLPKFEKFVSISDLLLYFYIFVI
jgi:hypothetical protein